MKHVFTAISLAAACLLASCSKEFLDTAPTSSVAEANIFSSTENAMLAINGMHRLMHEGGSSGTTTSWNSQGGYGGWCMHLAVMSDDVIFTYSSAMHQASAQWVHHQDLVQKYYDCNYYWKFFYRIIANCNQIFDYIDDIDGSNDYRLCVKGQAYAYRAFAHFQLVQGWAQRYDWTKSSNDQMGVIIRTNTSYDNLPRSTVEEVYAQILSDIDLAIENLEQTTVKKTNKTHIDQWVAKGIKARVLLTMGRWAEAASLAQDIIDHSGASLHSDAYAITAVGDSYHRFVDMTDSEWLWAEKGSSDQAQHDYPREFLQFFANCGLSYARNTPKSINSLLWESIPETDVRKACWVKDPYSVKSSMYLPSGTAYICPYYTQKWILADNSVSSALEDWSYMRLPEIYLIAAEGYAKSGNEAKAQQLVYDLAVTRDSAYQKPAETGDALCEKIMWQRRVELWAEAGLRWYDLKRLDLPCDRGPKPRDGYNQGGSKNGWSTSAKTMPTNLDPEASNYDMFGANLGEAARCIARPSENPNIWNWLVPTQELTSNPLCEQNPL